MTSPKQELFLITGIPGTGKTTFGGTLASQFGFVHNDLEEQQAINGVLNEAEDKLTSESIDEIQIQLSYVESAANRITALTRFDNSILARFGLPRTLPG